MLYGSNGGFEIEDRTLAHLQVVMVAKLRRSESFAFSWTSVNASEGREVIWISPSQALQFKYHGSRPPVLNRDWIEALMVTANSTAGLRIVPEPNPEGVGPEAGTRGLSLVP
jgi:hypothetical protein